MIRRIQLGSILIGVSLFILVTTAFPQDRKTSSLPPIYQKWLDEDVRWIITDHERADFSKLETDEQRDKFIVDFWERRNPNPGSEVNLFKQEHYRRLAYVNSHFAAKVPGFKTDRGRVYIMYGPPDEREQHPARVIPVSPPSMSYPTDLWRYEYIEGIGRDVTFKFVDTCDCGEFKLAIGENDLKKYSPKRRDPQDLQ